MNKSKIFAAAIAGAIVAAAHAGGLPLDAATADLIAAFLAGLILNFPFGKK